MQRGLIADFIFQNAFNSTYKMFNQGMIPGLNMTDPETGSTKRALLAGSLQELRADLSCRLFTGAKMISVFAPLFSIELSRFDEGRSILTAYLNLSDPIITLNELKMVLFPPPNHINGAPIIRRYIPAMVEAGKILRSNKNLISWNDFLQTALSRLIGS